MSFYMISNVFIWLCSLVSFILGAVLFFRPDKPLFCKMITMAVGCIAFGRIFQVLRISIAPDTMSGFQLGFLGVIGSLVFLFAVNYCIIDKAVDDHSPKKLKYRLVPIAFPVLAVAVYVLFILSSKADLIVKVCGGVLTAFVIQSVYFNAKHLFLPGKDTEIIRGLRMYNALALLYAYLCIAEMIMLSRGSYFMNLVLSFIIGIIVILLVPAVLKGVKKWKT